jgi:hypothetical protein
MTANPVSTGGLRRHAIAYVPLRLILTIAALYTAAPPDPLRAQLQRAANGDGNTGQSGTATARSSGAHRRKWHSGVPAATGRSPVSISSR